MLSIRKTQDVSSFTWDLICFNEYQKQSQNAVFRQNKLHCSPCTGACMHIHTHKHTNKEGGRTSFGVPFSDGNRLFGVLLSDGNHCKRMPKFMTLGINLNRRGVVTWMTIDQVNVYCKRQHIVKKLSFHLEVSKKQTRLRAVVPRRRRYIFPCIKTTKMV